MPILITKDGDWKDVVTAVVGMIVALVLFSVAMEASEEVWERYVAPACLLITVAAFFGFAIVIVMSASLGKRRR